MRISVVLLFLLSTFLLCGQTTNYAVFDVHHQVQLKARGSSTWSPAKKGAFLGLLDSVYVGEGSNIRLLDVRTNEVYRTSNKGAYRVKDIRDAAKKQSAALLSAVWSQISQDKAEGISSMKMVGATTRGQSEDVVSELSESIVCVAAQLSKGVQTNTSDLHLKGMVHGEEVSFVITNQSSRAYCVNVLCYDMEHQKASLCYVFSPTLTDHPYIVVPAAGTIDLSMWSFVKPRNGEKYVLIATEYTYDSTHLQQTLLHMNWKCSSIEPGELRFSLCEWE